MMPKAASLPGQKFFTKLLFAWPCVFSACGNKKLNESTTCIIYCHSIRGVFGKPVLAKQK